LIIFLWCSHFHGKNENKFIKSNVVSFHLYQLLAKYFCR
jgi:hypothetical protein